MITGAQQAAVAGSLYGSVDTELRAYMHNRVYSSFFYGTAEPSHFRVFNRLRRVTFESAELTDGEFNTP